MLSIITIPNNFVASTTEFMSQLFVDLSDPITFVLGVVAAGVLIEIIFGVFRRH